VVDPLARRNRLCAFFPLGGFSPLQSSELSESQNSLDATPMSCARLAAETRTQRAPHPRYVVSRASARKPCCCELDLPGDAIAALDGSEVGQLKVAKNKGTVQSESET